jgi:serine/threonine-protein kinase RsbW
MERESQEFPSELSQLAAMRALVRAVCGRAWGAPSAAVAQLELAVDESAANILLHAYEGKPGPPLELTVEADAAKACVAIYHGGRGFDPTTVPPPSFDGSRECGFGLYLVRQSVDDVAFVTDERGRHGIRLIKNC